MRGNGPGGSSSRHGHHCQRDPPAGMPCTHASPAPPSPCSPCSHLHSCTTHFPFFGSHVVGEWSARRAAGAPPCRPGGRPGWAGQPVGLVCLLPCWSAAATLSITGLGADWPSAEGGCSWSACPWWITPRPAQSRQPRSHRRQTCKKCEDADPMATTCHPWSRLHGILSVTASVQPSPDRSR